MNAFFFGHSMMILRHGLLVLFLTGLAALAVNREGVQLPPWHEGDLDIHHISTGCGNSTFLVMPDGTTMLIDAGDVDRKAMLKHLPLKVQERKPSGERRAGEWIADYIRRFAPDKSGAKIDYAVVSHFHSDHFGKVSETSPLSAKGQYRLGGITDVAEKISLGLLVDRAAPDYRIPFDLLADDPTGRGSLANYVRFVRNRLANGEKVERFEPGRNDQFRLLYASAAFPQFQVRNLAANGVIWSGEGNGSMTLVPEGSIHAGNFDENPLSIALLVTYGRFRYYAGADLPGLADHGKPAWFDVETPLSKVVGPVDVMALNHHGNRDSCNGTFLQSLRPRVVVQQNWISDQPGGEVVHRLFELSRNVGPVDAFSTGMHEETRVAIGPVMDKVYKSYRGHVVIRVASGGDGYTVFVLDDMDPRRAVLATHGPYKSTGR